MATTIIIYALALIGLTAAVVAGYDMWTRFNLWQSRIHIGRWDNLDRWEAAVTKRAKRWLAKMPVVPKKDSERLILLDMVNGQHRNATIQSWQQAGLAMGLNGHLDSQRLVDRFVTKSGQWRQQPSQVDFALLAYALMAAGMEASSPLEQIYQLILNTKGDNDTVPYRRGMPHVRFVDTLGFICPFLIKYGVQHRVAEAISLTERQLREYDTMLLAGDVNFPPHAIDTGLKLPLGVHDWGRGLGWYILAVVESRRSLPDGDFKRYLEKRVETLASQLLKFQKPSGGWGSSVFIADSPAEGSVTALAGLLMVEAHAITGRHEYLESARSAIGQLMKLTRRDGALDMCQGDTKGIGNYSTRYGVMPFAQGMALLLTKRYKDAHA